MMTHPGYRAARPLTTTDFPERITEDDLRAIGDALVQAACAMNLLGHEGPQGLISYVDPADLSWQQRFVLDMVAACTQVQPGEDKEAALDRVHGFVWQTGRMAETAEMLT